MPVLQRHGVLLEGDDRAAELSLEVFHDEPGLGLDLGHGPLARPRAPAARGEHVAGVPPAAHRALLARRPCLVTEG